MNDCQFLHFQRRTYFGAIIMLVDRKSKKMKKRTGTVTWREKITGYKQEHSTFWERGSCSFLRLDKDGAVAITIYEIVIVTAPFWYLVMVLNSYPFLAFFVVLVKRFYVFNEFL